MRLIYPQPFLYLFAILLSTLCTQGLAAEGTDTQSQILAILDETASYRAGNLSRYQFCDTVGRELYALSYDWYLYAYETITELEEAEILKSFAPATIALMLFATHYVHSRRAAMMRGMIPITQHPPVPIVSAAA